jgi:hypothetical protein
MEQAATLTVAGAGGASASASFPIGQNTAAWPTALPITEGRSYVLSGGGLPAPVRLRFAMLGTPATDPAGTYAVLDAKGCTAQKQLLLGALQSPN